MNTSAEFPTKKDKEQVLARLGKVLNSTRFGDKAIEWRSDHATIHTIELRETSVVSAELLPPTIEPRKANKECESLEQASSLAQAHLTDLQRRLSDDIQQWANQNSGQLGFPEARKITQLSGGEKEFAFNRVCPHCSGLKANDCSTCRTTGTLVCGDCKGAQCVTCTTCAGHARIKCRDCGGSSAIACRQCNHTGKSTCRACDGTSRVFRTCLHCNGTGNVFEYRWVSQGQNPPVEVREQVACPNCIRGKIEEQCPYPCQFGQVDCDHCHGKGSFHCTTCHEGWVTCPTCRGHKQIDCKTCNASGSVTCEPCQGRGEIACRDCAASGWQHTVFAARHAIRSDLSYQIAAGTPDDVVALVKENWPDNLPRSATVNMLGTTIENNTLTRLWALNVPEWQISLCVNGRDHTLRLIGQDVDSTLWQDECEKIGTALLQQDEQAVVDALAGKGSLRQAIIHGLKSPINLDYLGDTIRLGRPPADAPEEIGKRVLMLSRALYKKIAFGNFIVVPSAIVLALAFFLYMDTSWNFSAPYRALSALASAVCSYLILRSIWENICLWRARGLVHDSYATADQREKLLLSIKRSHLTSPRYVDTYVVFSIVLSVVVAFTIPEMKKQPQKFSALSQRIGANEANALAYAHAIWSAKGDGRSEREQIMQALGAVHSPNMTMHTIAALTQTPLPAKQKLNRNYVLACLVDSFCAETVIAQLANNTAALNRVGELIKAAEANDKNEKCEAAALLRRNLAYAGLPSLPFTPATIQWDNCMASRDQGILSNSTRAWLAFTVYETLKRIE